MTEEAIPRKWEYIADQLRQIYAPKKVINAAIEIDNAMVKLKLEYNTLDWRRIYSEDYLTLLGLINNSASCSACHDATNGCTYCRLGGKTGCTPRCKHADDYYSIVHDWVFQNR